MLKRLLVATSAIAASTVVAVTATTKSASAAFIDAPVPTNATITYNGLQWAWANPCAPGGSTCGAIDLSYQSQYGWRLPTLDELLKGPSALDFVFAGANVPMGGTDLVSGATFFGYNPGDAALATPYFSSIWQHGDWFDGVSGLWAGLAPLGTSDGYWETLVVRDLPSTPVPTPALLPGLIGMGIATLRKRKQDKVEA